MRNAVGSLTTIQFDSGDRSFSHKYRGALREEIPLISDRQLRKVIDHLRGLERKCFASGSRFAFYDYLAAVFELYVRLRRTKQAKKCGQLHCQIVRSPQPDMQAPHQGDHRRDLDRRHQDPEPLDACFRVRLARTENMDRFVSFLRENGGPAGCAEQFAAINSRRTYPGCTVYRYAGTGRPYLIVHRAA